MKPYAWVYTKPGDDQIIRTIEDGPCGSVTGYTETALYKKSELVAELRRLAEAHKGGAICDMDADKFIAYLADRVEVDDETWCGRKCSIG